MKKVTIQEVNNGYVVFLEDETNEREYVYSSVDTLKMLEFVGVCINGRKVDVKEH